jgi:3-(3-hydroxy-phenyl)propionate hydroxylase
MVSCPLAPRTYDIAIIGCGPTGALFANLLGQAGLSVAVFERDAAPTHLPRAIHYDGEVARVLQSAGLAVEVAKVSRPAVAGTRFMNPAGQTLMFRPGVEQPGPQGWPANSHIHQPNLEAVLRLGLERFPRVQLFSLHEVVGVDPVEDGALVSAEDKASGATWTCHAKYVVGCEGARSLVRRRMGARMEDLGLHQPWLVVDVLIDPQSERARAMPEYSIQFCDPSRPMSLIYVEGNRRRWEIMIMPGDEPERMTDPDRFWPMLSRWIGPEDAKVERSAVYTFHALIAHSWRRGPLLLAGDSCHQTPPFLGQGMCAGMRDAANLAWKLALVVKGEAVPDLLDTYESERSPHVAEFIKLAVELGGVLQTTDPVLAAERDARLTAGETMVIRIPEPSLGPGAWIPGAPANGKIFPQPRLADGRLMDQASRGRFAMVCKPALLDSAQKLRRQIRQALDVVVIPADSPELLQALEARETAAVLLRPDGYVFASANDAAELASFSHHLPTMLHIKGDKVAV